jgi:hypothetical protein
VNQLKPTRRPSLSAVLLGCAIVAALMFIGTVLLLMDRDDKARDADQAQKVATDQATTLDQLCATDPDIARRIPSDCREAKEVRRNVVLPASAPGPTQAQVQGWVTDYLTEHPPPAGRGATPEMVARAVAEHMEANGTETISDVARAYLAANAKDFRGQAGSNGTDGQPGQDARDAQVATAVAAFCAERNSCAGPEGPRGQQGGQGPQGMGLTDFHPERNSEGACEWVATYENPAAGTTEVRRYPAGDAACPGGSPVGGLLPGG